MYQALYRKYRPQTFEDVVGQNAVTQTLKTQIVTGKLSHAYLFTGSRGTGKTTCAKILAKAVNCENPQNGSPCNRCASCRAIDAGNCMDVLEIDAASNNGVDNVRDLRDDAIYTPSQVKMRVYIIDEVHMLSVSAFNALLKIIEEPPAHLLFILATTELNKVPATILSRCQRFSFRRIGQEEIAARLQYVAYRESIELDDAGARVLARMADGALRDGLSLLDQCASATEGELTAQRIYECLGIAAGRVCGELMEAVAARDTRRALEMLQSLYAGGKDLAALLDELACLCRDLLLLQTAPQAGLDMLSGIADEQQVKSLAARFSAGELVRMMELLQQTLAGFSRGGNRRMDVELCLMRMCQPRLELDAASLNARLTRLEDQLRAGIPAMPATQPPSVPAPAAAEASAPESQEQGKTEPTAEPDQPKRVRQTTPLGFWADLAQAVRRELKPPVSGFFTATPNAPVQGELEEDTVILRCANAFTMEMISGADVLELVARKASAQLDRPVRVKAVDVTQVQKDDGKMERLLDFGRAHSDIIQIQDHN